MPRSGRNTFGRPLPRRLCAGLALVAYLVAAGGFPLPAATARKDTSQPFPCMNNPCGCLSAEQCWRGCCCMTAEERWAWAEAHGVQPPEYAERPGASSSRKPCCASKGTRTNCCQPDSGCAREGKARDGTGTRWVLAVSALRCRGLSTQWVGAGAVLPPTQPLLRGPSEVAEEWLQPAAETASARPQAPPAPPPR